MVLTGRAKGAWGYVAAAGIALASAGSLRAENRPQPSPSQPSQAAQDQRAPEAAAPPPKGATPVAKTDEKAPEKPGADTIKATDWIVAGSGAASALFAGVLALFTWRLIVVGRDQHEAAMGALNLATKEFASTHRPKLRVRNINVKNTGSGPVKGRFTLIEPDEVMSGQLYVSNIGGSEATIKEIYVGFYGTETGLPMGRPYEGRDGNTRGFVAKLGPGQSTPVLFDVAAESVMFDMHLPSAPRMINPLQDKFYALGWVEYVDTGGRIRRTAFCRRYNHIENRDRKSVV